MYKAHEQKSNNFSTAQTNRNTSRLNIRDTRLLGLPEVDSSRNSSSFWQNSSVQNIRRQSSRWRSVDPSRPFKEYQQKDRLKVEVLELDKWKFMHNKMNVFSETSQKNKQKQRQTFRRKEPQLDTNLIDDILRGIRRPKQLILDGRLDSIEDQVGQEDGNKSPLKQQTNFNLGILKGLIDRETGEKPQEAGALSRMVSQKITNFKNLTQMLNKNRMEVWENISKENEEKAKKGQHEKKFGDKTASQMVIISHNYSFSHFKNQILEIQYQYIKCLDEKGKIDQKVEKGNKQLGGIVEDLKNLHSRINLIKQIKRKSTLDIKDLHEVKKQDVLDETNNFIPKFNEISVVHQQLKNQDSRRKQIFVQEKTFEGIKNLTEEKKKKEEEIDLLNNQLEISKQKKQQLEFQIMEICIQLLSDLRIALYNYSSLILTRNSEIRVVDIIGMLWAINQEVIFEMFPHMISGDLFQKLVQLSALELLLLFKNRKKIESEDTQAQIKTISETVSGEMANFFLRIFSREKELKIEMRFPDLQTAMAITDQISMLQERLKEGYRDMIYKSKRPMEYFKDLDVILYSFLGKRSSEKAYEEIKNQHNKSLIAQHYVNMKKFK